MPRPKRTDRPIEKSLSLPESMVARVELDLYSQLEGKVPFGAWSKFVEGLIERYWEKQKRLDYVAQAMLRASRLPQGPLRNSQMLEIALAVLNSEGYVRSVELFDLHRKK